MQGDDLVEVVARAVGAPLFSRAETRVGVGACFCLTDHPPAIASLHIKNGKKKAKMQKGKTNCETQNHGVHS